MRAIGHLTAVLLLALAGCDAGIGDVSNTAQSCMTCHNGSQHDDYAGPGLENPHPFPGADNLACTTCHGGNPDGSDKNSSHVPAPPEIGDRENWETDRHAYFNRLTLTGIDKFPDYTVGGVTYTAIDYLQFINPGDLRVVTQNRACGQCHQGHAECVNNSLLATEAGVLSGSMFSIGEAHEAGNTNYHNTAADKAFRAVQDPSFVFNASETGPVGSLVEFPVFSTRNDIGTGKLHLNTTEYLASQLPADQLADGRVVSGSPLANLFHEQTAFTCGDCHLGSAGANNRTGDYRSSGCTACHMQYSMGGRSGSQDLNVDKLEPLDPDDIDEPELAHVRAHRIQSVAKTLPSGHQVQGIDDYACAGCHQGSNRTVMQYWGIRLDQNEDVRRGVQYPANPVSFTTTRDDTRLFDPELGNREFNGRDHRQYLLVEDYDGDGRDDTPEDVHYEAGMGCIDCHGSYDLHGGDVTASGNKIMSHMEQSVAIRCESCHGTADTPAPTMAGQTYDGTPAQVAMDSKGNPLRHVVKEGNHYYLISRLTGQRHYVTQTRDTIVKTGRSNTITGQPVWSAKASYAMGRDDGDTDTGIGPQQTACTNCTTPNFSHMDRMSCVSCHASWTNTCVGCHLEGEYNTGNNFSNITGDRIVFRERFADFVYQSPVPFQLGVDSHNKITQVSPNTKTFFRYRDINGDLSNTFAFSDRNAQGNNVGNAHRALGHNAIMAHSVRGKVASDKEGPRYCASCHLTDDGLNDYGLAKYQTFMADMAAGNFGSLDYGELQTHIGLNPGNTLNSPLWVHMVAGLGSGLFLFDQNGCPENPLDTDDQRKGCNNVAPANKPFNPANVFYNLDRLVEMDGSENSSSNHALLDPLATSIRDGAGVLNPMLAGPLGSSVIQSLADPVNGIILDSWIDADGNLQGDAGLYVVP